MLQDTQWPLECIEAAGLQSSASPQLKLGLLKIIKPVLDKLNPQLLKQLADCLLQDFKARMINLDQIL